MSGFHIRAELNCLLYITMSSASVHLMFQFVFCFFQPTALTKIVYSELQFIFLRQKVIKIRQKCLIVSKDALYSINIPLHVSTMMNQHC